MNTDFIKGVVVPILTPIDADERIDEAAFRRQIDYVIDGGMHGILVFGSNGEFYQIEEDEMERGLQIAVSQAAGRIPVYFGIGAINTKKCVRLAKMAVRNGAAAVSILQPMFLKPTQDELFLHFKTVAEAIPETPVLLYNNPGRVGYGMTTALITRLAHEVDNIVGMKDTSGDITLTEECVRLNRDIGFKVFGGKDTLLYASLCVGAVGGVCTAGNFMPELIGAVYERYAAGDMQGSMEAQFKLNPVRLSMDPASFPVAAKDMAKLRGLEVGDPYRPNLPTPEGPVLENIRKAMRDAGLIESKTTGRIHRPVFRRQLWKHSVSKSTNATMSPSPSVILQREQRFPTGPCCGRTFPRHIRSHCAISRRAVRSCATALCWAPCAKICPGEAGSTRQTLPWPPRRIWTPCVLRKTL